MIQATVMAKLRDLLDEVGVGILTTIDEKGRPCSRWMTPVFLPHTRDALFAVTSKDFRKIGQLDSNPRVSWIFQSKTLDRVATVSGAARVVRVPRLSAEVIEAIGPRLEVFWACAGDPKNLVVVETAIESATWFRPMTGERLEEEVPHG